MKKERRYDVHVSRDRATDLFTRSAPGYDEWLPHDVLHFVAEAEFGLDEGVFGNLGAGGNARIFIPVDPKETVKLWRKNRKKRVRLADGPFRRARLGARARLEDAGARRDAAREARRACGTLACAAGRRRAHARMAETRAPTPVILVAGTLLLRTVLARKPSRLELLLSPTYLPS